jgi:hypothetical protein
LLGCAWGVGYNFDHPDLELFFVSYGSYRHC